MERFTHFSDRQEGHLPSSLQVIADSLQEKGIPVESQNGITCSVKEYSLILAQQSLYRPSLLEQPLTARLLARYKMIERYNPNLAIHYRPQAEFDGGITLVPTIVEPNPLYSEGGRMPKYFAK